MKTKFNLIICLVAVVLFSTSCEEDNSTFDTFDGPTLISFRQNAFELSVPQEDITLEIPVSASTLSTTARTFNATATDATEGSANEYSIGSITIPANEYIGTLTVDFDFSEIGGNDGDIRQLTIGIDAPADAIAYSSAATVSYFKEIVCNDLNLTIISDQWATETYFSLETADGTVLAPRFFPFAGNGFGQVYELDFTLPDGDYILKIGDAFGDGMVSTPGNGSYSLTCSIITHASGGGEFAATPDPFNGAPDAIIEVTEFSVNP